MNIEDITAQLKVERERIDKAIAALNGTGVGRATGTRRRRGPRKMSAEARARIAAAQKARWAKVRAGKKK
jgi:hypothetical protein